MWIDKLADIMAGVAVAYTFVAGVWLSYTATTISEILVGFIAILCSMALAMVAFGKE